MPYIPSKIQQVETRILLLRVCYEDAEVKRLEGEIANVRTFGAVRLFVVVKESDYSTSSAKISAKTAARGTLWYGPHERDCQELLLLARSGWPN